MIGDPPGAGPSAGATPLSAVGFVPADQRSDRSSSEVHGRQDQTTAPNDDLPDDGDLPGDGDLPPVGDLGYEDDEAPRDWAWVEEWRESQEPVPWGPGLAIAGFTLFLVASAVYVLSAGLLQRPLLAIGVNVLVFAGLCPALWLSRSLPVLRWVAAGAAAGVLVAWFAVLVFLT